MNNYLDLNTNRISSFEFKKHTFLYGLSIKEANLEGVIINNEIKNVNLSFIPRLNLIKEQEKRKIKDLIKKYLVTTHTKYGPIFQTGRGPESDDTQVTDNYFEERKKSKDDKKKNNFLKF